MNQFTIEITLASFDNAMVQMAAVDAPFTYTVSEVRYYAPCYQVLDEQIMSQYAQQVASQPIMWIGQSVNTITNAIAAAAGKQTLQINSSYRSLNGLCTLVRTSKKIDSSGDPVLANNTIKEIAHLLMSDVREIIPVVETDGKNQKLIGGMDRKEALEILFGSD